MREKLTRHTCDQCGESFERYKSQITGANKFCDTSCYGKHQKKSRMGLNEKAWKTARCVQCEGVAKIRRHTYKKRVNKNSFYCVKCRPTYYNKVSR